jgi:ankyrin repeat protein
MNSELAVYERFFGAAAAGDLATVRQLCESEDPRLPAAVDPAADDSKALHNAVRNGHLHVVRYLCELPRCMGVNPAAVNNCALLWAVLFGHLDIVRYLCELPAERGVNPAARDNHFVRAAAYNGKISIVQYLCELPPERGVDPAAHDNTALHWAANRGRLDVVQYLCELLEARGVEYITDTDFVAWGGFPPAEEVQAFLREHCASRAARVARWSDLRASWVAAAVTSGSLPR